MHISGGNKTYGSPCISPCRWNKRTDRPISSQPSVVKGNKHNELTRIKTEVLVQISSLQQVSKGTKYLKQDDWCLIAVPSIDPQNSCQVFLEFRHRHGN